MLGVLWSIRRKRRCINAMVLWLCVVRDNINAGKPAPTLIVLFVAGVTLVESINDARNYCKLEGTSAGV